MLTITVLGDEFYDESCQEFLTKNDVVLHLEHSLVSLSKWESIWEVPFLGSDKKTPEQLVSYVKCMVLGSLPSEDVFSWLTKENFETVNAYLDSKHSATYIHEIKTSAQSREKITSELIYYWMVAANVPFECQHWNLNNLFNLIRICGIKNSKPKKMSPSEMASRNRELNAQRKQAYNTTG